MIERLAARLVPGLLVASAFALGITKTQDPDAWTHLALGREMVRLRGFPPHEPFDFPSAALPYHNTEWLFDLVLYLVHLAGGFLGVALLKGAIVALVVWILWKDATRPVHPAPARPLRLASGAAVLFPALFMVRYRIVERPDLALMLFLALTIYALNAFLHRGSRLLYVLPALAVLWVNTHPSLVVAAVPFGAVLAGGGVQRLLQRWPAVAPAAPPSGAQLRTVGAVLAGVLVASVLNPYGLDALLLPFRLVGPSFFTQQINELQPPGLTAQPGPYIVTALLVLTFAILARRLPIPAVLLVAPFAVLAHSAVRYVFLLAIVGAPILARNLALVAAPLAAVGPRAGAGLALGVAVIGAGTTGLTLLGVGPLADPLHLPGFGVDHRHAPEGALRYLDRVGITGRVFNTFHSGGYIAWRDFPRRQPIVDGRAYLPPGLVEEVHFARAHADHLDRLQAVYGFDVAIVTYPNYEDAALVEAGGRDLGLTSPKWALVYWDDVALVYLRRTDALAGVIERDQYRWVKPANGPVFLTNVLAAGAPAAAVDAELRRNVEATHSSLGWVLLGFARLHANALDEALAAFERVAEGPWKVNALEGQALAWGRRGEAARVVESYRAVLARRQHPGIHYALGLALATTGDDRGALRHFERAHRMDPDFLPVYRVLADAYRPHGAPERVEALAQVYVEALTRARVREHLRKAQQLAREGKREEATAELSAALRLDPRAPAALSQIGWAYLTLGRLDEALAQHLAALRQDPELATAHHGLAVVYRRRGQDALARRHFDAYLRLEPRSYAAWRIRQELGRLPR